ncbi:hypothetical protein [Massilia pseudoviolaceinigra]|uniref:hypothetical protein n=1 Tax=Massilia pseudoviolaceinigra TaxID=3057165 RepID=UPI002796CEF8|nr:hypothetical protein [Massilia sp. CCM 9206]MDQ1920067.1 hypothetical protein [Massilia sp. CCM 9206]
MSLGSHANVYNTCLLILRDRGFKMHVEGELDDEGCYPTDLLWIAEKDGFRFMADNPIELLGLVGVYDHMQPSEDRPYWWRKEGEDVRDQIMSEAFPQGDAGDE